MEFLNVDDVCLAISPTAVDASEIAEYKRESQHTFIAFELTKETAHWVTVLSHVAPDGAETWTVEQAVLFGHFVRLAKLMRFLMESTSNRRAELAWVAARMIVECTINARYLLKHRSPELIASFLHQSLQHDLGLRHTIVANIDARGGSPLPIETRMLASIDRTFKNSEVAIEDLPTARIKNWGNKTFFQRVKDLELERAYSSVFGAPSRNVHGNWADLMQHHLETVSPGRFMPDAESKPVRPQLLFAVTQLSVQALQGLAEYIGTPDAKRILSRLRDLQGRVSQAESLHEAYLAPAATPS